MKTKFGFLVGLFVFGIGLVPVDQSEAQIFGGRFRMFSGGNTNNCCCPDIGYSRGMYSGQYVTGGFSQGYSTMGYSTQGTQGYDAGQSGTVQYSDGQYREGQPADGQYREGQEGNDQYREGQNQDNSSMPPVPQNSQPYTDFSAGQGATQFRNDVNSNLRDPQGSQQTQTYSPIADPRQTVGNYQDTDSRVRQPQDEKMAMNQFLASKLILCNNEVIKMSQAAAEKSDHNGVKELAAMLVQQHQQMNEKLQPFKARYADNAMLADDRANSDSATLVAGDNTAPKNVRETGFRESPNSVYSEMYMICRQASQYKQEQCERMMSQASAEDYNMAFVGAQIAGHQMFSAELRAIEERSTGEFQSTIREARQTVDSHLEKATQLAKQLKGDSNSAPTDR